MAAWLKFLLSSERARRISNMLIAFALLCFGFWFSCFVFPGLFFFSGNHNKVLGGQVNWYTDTRLKIYANTTTFPPKHPCPRVCVKPFEIFMKSILRRARQLSNLAGSGSYMYTWAPVSVPWLLYQNMAMVMALAWEGKLFQHSGQPLMDKWSQLG